MIPRPLLLLLLAVALAACEPAGPRYQLLSGDSGRFADFQGKTVFINYWAEWCKPCIEEMPELAEFAREHADEVVVLAVNFDGVSGDALQAQVDKIGVEIPVLLSDPAPVYQLPRPQALPTTYVIGRDGQHRASLLGPQTVASLSEAVHAANAEENAPVNGAPATPVEEATP